jgi:hypothetical protein
MAVPVLGYEAHTWKEGLLGSHVVAWIAAAYCYWLVQKLPVGIPRCIASVPVLALYAVVPLIFSRATHLVGLSALYCILTWIGSSKVLLLCWGHGPGCEPWVASSFPRFAIVMTYPAHVKRADWVVKKVPVEYSSWWNHVSKSEVWYMLVVRSGMKVAVLAILLQLLSRRASLPLIVIHLLLSIQLYLFGTIVLEVLAAIASATFGVTIEPHFDNPFAAASLAEFWGRRWNLLVSNVLRDTVYNPLLYLLGSEELRQGNDRARVSDSVSANGARSDWSGTGHGSGLRQCSRSLSLVVELVSVGETEGRRFDVVKLVATLASFLVSGLMHELLVYYATLEATWEMMSFFVVQGIAVAAEATWKLYRPSSRVPRVVATVATLGFAFATGHFLFWPPLDGISEQVAMEMQKMLQV